MRQTLEISMKKCDDEIEHLEIHAAVGLWLGLSALGWLVIAGVGAAVYHYWRFVL